METFVLLVDVDMYTFLLKFVEPLSVLLAKVKLQPGASPLGPTPKPPAEGAHTQRHVTEEDEGRREPRSVLIGHDVTVAVVLPQLIGRGGHVEVHVVEECNEDVDHDNVLEEQIHSLEKRCEEGSWRALVIARTYWLW